MTLAEQNNILAEFMGKRELPYGWIAIEGRLYAYQKKYYPNQLKYHSSWGWLIPVWVKFRNKFYEVGSKNAEWEGWITALSYYLTTSDEPKRFFERIYYAIEWYNKQKDVA